MNLADQMWWPGYNVLDPLAEGLVLAMPFREGPGTGKTRDVVGDESGRLTNMDPARDWEIHPGGYGLDFDGSNDLLNCGTGVPYPANAISIAMRIYSDSGNATYRCIGGRGTTHYWFELGDPASNIAFACYIGGSKQMETTSVAQDTWVDIVGTYNGAEHAIWVNGAKASSTARTGVLVTTSTPFVLAARTGLNIHWMGKIQWAGLWSRGLLHDEIVELHEYPDVPLFTPPPRVFPVSVAGGGAITGSTPVTFAATGAVTGGGALAGSTPVTFAATGAVTGGGALAGSTPATFAPTGPVTGGGALAGSAAATFAATGTIRDASATGAVTGSLSMTFTAAGTLRRKILGPYRIAAAQTYQPGTVAGALFTAGAVAGELFTAGAVAGQLAA